jgi:hypothetical protein
VRIRAEAPADREAIAAVMAAAFGKEDEARLPSRVEPRDRGSDPSIADEAFIVVPLGAYEPPLRGRVAFPPAFG